MSNLVGTAVALDQCRFYVENMVNIQLGTSLAAVPPEPKYNQPINARALHSSIENTLITFDSAVNRPALGFPYAPMLYRFRSIYGTYCNQYLDDVSIKRTVSRIAVGNPLFTQPVPVRVKSEPDVEFAARFLKHTAEQVHAFMYMVCLDQYAREQTDAWLPCPPHAFVLPDSSELEGNGVAYSSIHNELVSHLMEAMLQTCSDTLDIHISLRDYGLEIMFPLVAECRNVIYAAWPNVNHRERTPQFQDSGENVSFGELQDDSGEV